MVDKKTLIVVFDGKKDYFGRRLYGNLYTEKMYVDVDGELHTMTKEGEPLDPLRNKIIYKDNSD